MHIPPMSVAFESVEIALKGLFLQHCVVFSLYCVAIVISESFFLRGLIFGLILRYQTEKVCGSIFLV